MVCYSKSISLKIGRTESNSSFKARELIYQTNKEKILHYFKSSEDTFKSLGKLIGTIWYDETDRD